MDRQQLLKQEIEREPDLPVLPPGVAYLLKVLNDDDIGYAQLAGEIEKFPSIAIKIVATANSAWAAPVTPITTLRDSCARIGVKVVRSISIALSVAQVFDPCRCPLFDPKIFWTSALLTAEAAHISAKSNPDVCPDTARLVGLLHNIGLLWLANQRPVETSRAISLSQSNDGVTLSQALDEEIGVDLYTAGGYLTSYLELPDVITDAIASPAARPTKDPGSKNPLIVNHLNALRLASSALLMANAKKPEDQVSDDEPHIKQISEALPAVKSMAQALFFS